jgi:hypothetical protein
MSWIEVPESSTIARFRHMSETSVLEIEFKKGGVYHYFDVPDGVAKQMQNAASKGQYFAQHIKGIFRFARA